MARQEKAQNHFKSATQQKAKDKGSGFALKYDHRYPKVLGVVLLAFSALLVLAFTSFLFSWEVDQSLAQNFSWEIFKEANPQMAKNWMGVVGAYLGHLFIYRWFGLAAYLFVFMIGLLGLSLLFRYQPLPLGRNLSGSLFFIAWISITLGFLFEGNLAILGGGFGYATQHWLKGLLGTPGLVILLIVSLMVYAILAFDINFTLTPFIRLKEWFVGVWQRLWLKGYQLMGYQTANAGPSSGNETAPETAPATDATTGPGEQEGDTSAFDPATNEPSPSDTTSYADPDPEEPGTSVELDPAVSTSASQENQDNNDSPDSEASEAEDEIPSLEIEDTREQNEVEEAEDHEMTHTAYDPTLDLSLYQFPPVDLLNEYNTEKRQINQEELEERKNLIINTLKNYKIDIDKIKATVGPTVTLYEIVPAPGVRISKIRNLEDDIALSLAALGIRIIAPIPGRGTIGIEVPNSNPEMVGMKNILASKDFKESTNELPIALGKTISNEVYLTDLTNMPHLLMAGATGQGKSVGLNVMLGSLLYKKHPSQVKFVLVDPKKVELSLFQKIKNHFLAQLPNAEEPIITDTNQVITSLNSLCTEMDQRYDLLKDAQVRNLAEYNRKFINRQLNPEKGHRFLPYIVLVIDEMADLMMTAGKEVEAPIARLAQLARAIGIHLILATQRPSVNIITGVIKANFPARIAFRVTSRVDSRTILDAGGAEQLIGKGDMLFTDGGDLIRLQCAFLDTEEIETVTNFISEQQAYTHPYELPEAPDKNGGEQSSAEDVLENLDPLFNEAAQLIVKHQQGSTSLIQRRLKLGYNRAGRIVDQLEAAGVIGPYEGSKSREVLIDDEYALEQFLTHLGENK
jgi:S-DNA-T family DNA segregation ATPase FtsK/SpoIIIE